MPLFWPHHKAHHYYKTHAIELEGFMMLKNVILVLEENQGSLFSTTETAELIGKSTAWLERHRWAGTGIPYDKIGRTPYYRAQTLLDYVTGGNVA